MSLAHLKTQPSSAPMAGEWKVNVGGSPVIWGDANVRIIFFNLNGRNFEAREPWRQQTHPQYLEYMNSVFPGAFLPGQTITLIDPDGSVVGEHTFVAAVEDAVDPEQVDEEGASAWQPVYSPWRQGGWYVSNLRYPGGSCGCVSNNFPDKQWRIVCDSRRKELGEEGDFTYPTRDAAARAERELVGW
ncbi:MULTISPECIES: hypothetical protein [Pseudomonas]|nr:MULTISPECIES: hypothetical protein [Pseudomonas]